MSDPECSGSTDCRRGAGTYAQGMNPKDKRFSLTPEDERCFAEAVKKVAPGPKPANEQKRLEVLWQYDVIDTMPEDSFNDLAELAACICDAPIALISLIDENREWFKAKVGVSLSELSRNIAFCSHTIMSTGVMVVPDALEDIRFADNPLVTCKPYIRFYAGAPLMTKDGYALGTICVLDQVPRELTLTQEQALRVLSRFVMTQLEIRRNARQIATVSGKTSRLEAEVAELRTQLAEAQRELSKKSP
jgi:GAF domain-containing protein